MIKVAVSGALGKMGQRILWNLKGEPGFQVISAIEREGHPDLGKEIGRLLGIPEYEVPLISELEALKDKPDCLIEFSTPEATLGHARWAARNQVAMVIGTTGFSKAQMEELKAILKEARAVIAPNMSVGVNLMLYLAQVMARVLGEDFDVEIWEAHHRLKKDAPSGTALKILEVVSQALGRDPETAAVYARKGIVGERTKKEIGLQVIRAGDIIGEHTLLFGGIGERLELTHRAHSRDTFARGAIKAARWVVDREKGIYDMQDVLGLKQGIG